MIDKAPCRPRFPGSLARVPFDLGLPGPRLQVGRTVLGLPMVLPAKALRGGAVMVGPDDQERQGRMAGLAVQAIGAGWGCVVVDGNGTPGIGTVMQEACRKAGRTMQEMDLSSGAWSGPEGEKVITMNPFLHASRQALVDILVGMVDQGQDRDMVGTCRLYALLAVATPVMCALRDLGHVVLDAGSLHRMLSVQGLRDLAADTRGPAQAREALDVFLSSMAATVPNGCPQDPLDQWLSLALPLVERPLQVLSQVMPRVFTARGEPDVDVGRVLDRGNVLLLRLPMMGHSYGETAVPAMLLASCMLHWAWGRVSQSPSPPTLALLDRSHDYPVTDLSRAAASMTGSGLCVVHSVRDEDLLEVIHGGRSILANSAFRMGPGWLSRYGDRIRLRPVRARVPAPP